MINFFTSYSEKSNDLSFEEIFQNNKVVHTFLKENEDPSVYFRSLANQVGIPLIYEEDPKTGELHVNKWTEIKYEAENSNDTYKSSNKSQPLHSDYGYFSFEIFASFFYCEEQAEFGGATTFLDVDTLVFLLKSIDLELFDLILKTKIHFGRADNPIAHNWDYILTQDEFGWKINWNYYRALDDKENLELIERFKAFLDNNVEKSGELRALKLQPNEAVFFQDRRVLHGRNSFMGNRKLNKGGIAKSIPKEVQKTLHLEL